MTNLPINYLQADNDVNSMRSDDMGGICTQLDFMTADQGLVEHDVKQMIVVGGSTHFREPNVACMRLEAVCSRPGAHPQGPELKWDVTVATSFGPAEYRI